MIPINQELMKSNPAPLDFSYRVINDADAKNLANSLANNAIPAIVALSLPYAEHSEEDEFHILNSNSCSQNFQIEIPEDTTDTLASLSLHASIITAEGIKHIADALTNNSTLAILDLEAAWIGNEGAQHIAAALKTNSMLTSLNLGGNSIEDHGAHHIAEALKTNSALTSLHLHYNKVTDEGIQEIADALKINSTLTELNCSDIEITSKGGEALGEALKTNSTLTMLTLDENEYFGDEGAKFIADALHYNSTLTKLGLAGTDITSEGTKSIATALEKNSTLTSLNIEANRFTHDEQTDDPTTDGVQALVTALFNNSTLTELYWDDDLVCHMFSIGYSEEREADLSEISLTPTLDDLNNLFSTPLKSERVIRGILERNKDNKEKKESTLFQLLVKEMMQPKLASPQKRLN